MEAVKIITLPPSENPASAAPLSTSAASRRNNAEIKCGAARATAARGLTYEGALRRKLRLDLLSWGDLKRKAQALIEADHEDLNVSLLQ